MNGLLSNTFVPNSRTVHLAMAIDTLFTKGGERSQRASHFLLTSKLFSAHQQTFFCSPAEFLLLTSRIQDARRQWDSNPRTGRQRGNRP